MKPDGGYQPIFLEPDWVYEKYHGWKVVEARSDFRVFLKRFGPIRRYLVLSRLNRNQLCSELSKLQGFDSLSTVTIKDCSTPNQGSSEDLLVDALRVPRVEDAERMLNKYTFVIDLAQEIDKLWSNLNTNSKRVCKKAATNGMAIECSSSPAPNILAIFFDRYKTMARERSLLIPSRGAIEQMFGDGRLRMFYARTEDTIHTMILVYSTALTSYYLYGVPGTIKNDSSGQFVHWQAIEYLKRAGQRWYDLGGVREAEISNGIYRFKKGLGGEFVDLGTEYYYCPNVLLIAKRVYKALRSVL